MIGRMDTKRIIRQNLANAENPAVDMDSLLASFPRKPQVPAEKVNREELVKIMKVWHMLNEIKDIGYIAGNTEEALYKYIKGNVEKIRVNQETIQAFVSSLDNSEITRKGPSHVLRETWGGRAGMLVSALAKNSTDSEININVEHLQDKDGNGSIHFMGAYLEDKTLRVKGNLGSASGFRMKSGRLEIDGNVLDKTGEFMEGGGIHVTGKAGKLTGELRYSEDCLKVDGTVVSWGITIQEQRAELQKDTFTTETGETPSEVRAREKARQDKEYLDSLAPED